MEKVNSLKGEYNQVALKHRTPAFHGAGHGTDAASPDLAGGDRALEGPPDFLTCSRGLGRGQPKSSLLCVWQLKLQRRPKGGLIRFAFASVGNSR